MVTGQGLDEVYYEVYDWRSLLEEYKKKDDQTRFMVTESYVELKYLMKYYGNETNLGAHFPFNVCLLGLPHRSAKEFLEVLTEWMSNLPSGAWSNWVIGNHDINRRATSRFGLELIDGIHMLQLLLPGTPVVYMGDELGMTDTYLRYDQLIEDMSKEFASIPRETVRTPFHGIPHLKLDSLIKQKHGYR
eukprot:XP_016659004.1 PREDICTED: maltase A1-like [Acyrthosiphon pisum]